MTVKVPCGRTLGHGESCEEGYLCEQCAEIERLRARLAIQFGMHSGGDLAKAAQAEIERLKDENEHIKDELADWRKEGERLRAVAQARSGDLRAAGADVIANLRVENERLKLDRQHVKRAIEELLERYGQIAADMPPVPHYGLGRGGLKPVK